MDDRASALTRRGAAAGQHLVARVGAARAAAPGGAAAAARAEAAARQPHGPLAAPHAVVQVQAAQRRVRAVVGAAQELRPRARPAAHAALGLARASLVEHVVVLPRPVGRARRHDDVSVGGQNEKCDGRRLNSS